MWACLGIVGLAAIVWLLVWRLDPTLRRIRKFQAELAAREPVPDAELAARFFASSDVAAEVPARVRRLFAKHMGYPAEKLLPDDDLVFFWDELDMGDLLEELEEEFGIAITDAEVERTPCTIRAVTLLVVSKSRCTEP